MTENEILAFKIVKDQVAHHTSRVLMKASHFVYGCLYQSYRWSADASLRRKREAMRFRVSQVIRPSNSVGGA